jgi:hypothetical protein
MTALVTSVLLAAAVSAGAADLDIDNVRGHRNGAAPEASSAQAYADEIRRRVKEGQKILIVDDQGRELTGRIGELRADALMLLVGRDRSDVPYDRILRIDRPRDGVSDGALKGLGIGVGLGLLAGLAAAADDSDFLDFGFADVAPIAAPVLGGIGALFGLALDASIRHQPNLYRRTSATRINLSPTVGRGRRGMAISVSW